MMTSYQTLTIEAAIAAMAAAAREYRASWKLAADSPEVAGWVGRLDDASARLAGLSPDASADETVSAMADAIDAMAEATSRFRRGAGLPGKSTDVPQWVAELDAAQVALTIIAEAMRRALAP